MRITHNKVGQNLNLRDSGKAEGGKDAGKTGAAGKAVGSPGAAGVDALAGLGENSKADDATRVNLSSRAQDMKRAKEIATSSPDINEARVAELQKLIDAGKYKVDAKDIADKMVDEHMAWGE